MQAAQHGGAALARHVAQQAEYLAADRGIEARHRLIRQDHLGVEQQRPRDADALLLPARQRRRPATQVQLVESHPMQRGAGAGAQPGGVPAQIHAPRRRLRDRAAQHVGGDAGALHQVELLVHHRDPAAHAAQACAVDDDAVQRHPPAVERGQPVDRAQESRLARAGPPQHDAELATPHVETHVRQSAHPIGESPFEMGEGEVRPHPSLCRRSDGLSHHWAAFARIAARKSPDTPDSTTSAGAIMSSEMLAS